MKQSTAIIFGACSLCLLSILVSALLIYQSSGSFDPKILRSEIERSFAIFRDSSTQVKYPSSNEDDYEVYDSTPELLDISIAYSDDIEYVYAIKIRITSEWRRHSVAPDQATYEFFINEDYELKKTKSFSLDPFDPVCLITGQTEEDPEHLIIHSVISAAEYLAGDQVRLER